MCSGKAAGHGVPCGIPTCRASKWVQEERVSEVVDVSYPALDASLVPLSGLIYSSCRGMSATCDAPDGSYLGKAWPSEQNSNTSDEGSDGGPLCLHQRDATLRVMGSLNPQESCPPARRFFFFPDRNMAVCLTVAKGSPCCEIKVGQISPKSLVYPSSVLLSTRCSLETTCSRFIVARCIA